MTILTKWVIWNPYGTRFATTMEPHCAAKDTLFVTKAHIIPELVGEGAEVATS